MTAYEPPPHPQQEAIDQLLRDAGRQDVIDSRNNGSYDQNGYGYDPTPDEQSPPSSWIPVDLTAALSGEDIPAPTLWTRSDDTKLIYPGRTHWFQGESESAKSWAAQTIVADELKTGNHVLYIDFEDDDRGVVSRLRSLTVPPDNIRHQLTYLRPDEPLRNKQGHYTDAWTDFAALLEHTYTLAIVDGVTEAMTTEDLNLLDNTDIANWNRLLPKRLAGLGSAVICIDHVTKDRESQGRYAIGGQHKLAGVTGAVYRFTTIRPLARALAGEPVEGIFQVTIHKDRVGYVRGRAPDGQIGLLAITAYPDQGVTWSLDPPGIGPSTVDIKLAHSILEYLAMYEGVSQNKIEDNVTGGAPSIREAVRWMVDEAHAWIRIEHVGRTHCHYITQLGRDEIAQES